MSFQESQWLPPQAGPPPPPPPEPRRPPEIPLWAPFATLFAALFLVLTLGGALVAVLEATDRGFDARDLPVGLQLGLTAFQSAVFVFGAWITVRLVLGRTPRAQFGLNRVRRLWPAVGWAVLVYVGLIGLQNLLVEVFSRPDDQQLVKDVRAEDSLLVLGSYFVLICIVAPVVEEFFFRGFMFTVLMRRMNVLWAAVIVGAVFGLGHSPAPAVSLLALAAFGVGLCLLYWRTQSIVPCMALHALNNAITFAVIKDLDPGLFAAVVVGSVGAVAAGAHAVSTRSRVAA